MEKELTLQAFWGGVWHDAGVLSFPEPGQGLLSKEVGFAYNAGYVLAAYDHRESGDGEALSFSDERAFSMDLPATISGDYRGHTVTCALRDIIPQGAGRRVLLRALGYDMTAEQSADIELLENGCIAPVGNLRIREAFERFSYRLEQTPIRGYTTQEISNRADPLIEQARELNIAIGGTTGVGGDAPKVMVSEADDGLYYIEGTCDERRVVRHWIIKFARGRRTRIDQDVLRAEAAVYRALEPTPVRSIDDTYLIEGNNGPALWLPRFDRRVNASDGVERLGMQSIYCLMGMHGDGAALSHNEVVQMLMRRFHDDDILVDYLVNDIINETIANRDNHGRNTAILTDAGHRQLAPAFDLAPMVMDPEGISRSSAWRGEWQHGQRGEYAKILEEAALAPSVACRRLKGILERVEDLRARLETQGAPEAMLDHQAMRFNLIQQIIAEL
ncbi:serine/threonine-protein kinase HipA [Halospina denitrificans]|uniref:Serine/threonine-protein kinase HipA n=1 Tax=Halospina denitrificans TaxID=332522 RepID=A0A4R7JYM5_9GAMM|nr:HipA domain-containing protein [Halospina denitrificans]TDT43176.1 serine/threonine-protein kinase HipA [Halospina denitrificans]